MALVQVAFKANQRFIAERLCVNRHRPELHCDGKCVLAKMLAEQQRRQDEQRAHLELAVASFVATEVRAPRLPASAPVRPARVAVRRPADDRAGPLGVATDVFRPPQG